MATITAMAVVRLCRPGRPRLPTRAGRGLLLNAGMFVTEMVAGVQTGSVSLWADAADF